MDKQIGRRLEDDPGGFFFSFFFFFFACHLLKTTEICFRSAKVKKIMPLKGPHSKLLTGLFSLNPPLLTLTARCSIENSPRALEYESDRYVLTGERKQGHSVSDFMEKMGSLGVEF